MINPQKRFKLDEAELINKHCFDKLWQNMPYIICDAFNKIIVLYCIYWGRKWNEKEQ